MQRSTDRILTTHVGSLIRPAELRDLLLAQMEGRPYDTAAFDATLERTVADVVARQQAIGLDIVNDGEFGKTLSWSRYVLDRLSGFEPLEQQPADAVPAGIRGRDRREFAEFYADYDPKQMLLGIRASAVRSPIAYKGHAVLDRDIAELQRQTAGRGFADVFMTAVAPASVVPDRKDEYYPDDEAYLMAVADALRVEYRAIVDAGFILQVDDAYLASMYDLMVPPSSMADYRRWAAVRVDVLNHALEGLPEGRTRYHVCWGSWNGPHVSDVPLKDIADLVLKVRVGGYCLEMANVRHEHEWRVWESVKLPAGRVLVPGVISHATNVVEHPELVAERIVRLAKVVGRENVIAGTDCGFAQGPFVQRVHPTIQWAKLGALVEGARLASQTLWS